MKKFLLTKILFLVALLTFTVNSYAQKMSAEEVIVKHLDSIGTKEARDKVQNQIVVGDVRIKIKGIINDINGRAVILSSNPKSIWAMHLTSNDYPQERFGFDGKDVKVNFARPGEYSDLGRFVSSYGEVLKEGLLGGTLSSSWTLLDINSKKSKLSFDGTKKVDGKDTYVLSYSTKSGSGLTIKMYFDKQNFQHVRTEYNRVIAATMGTTVDNSASQSESRYRLIEDFSNFQKVGNLTLPGTYKLSYSFYSSNPIQLQEQNHNREMEMQFNMTNFSFNEALEPNIFEVNGN